MGGGGGSTFGGRSPSELLNMVRQAEERAVDAAFAANLSQRLGELLATFNGRDVNLVRERLDLLKDALASSLEGSFDQLFGGSVAKHTYVDGLSDVDSIVLINDSSLHGKGPDAVLARMTEVLSARLGEVAKVSHGRMAVTVDYSDGMSIQLLPALKEGDGKLRVPSSRNDGWSKIDPAAFQNALTTRNKEMAGKLVPTIKLAKAINGQLPESQQLSGYHMESLAIAAFRNYQGDKTTAAMLPHFFERSKDLVMNPISDRTGQSIHVDEYLGAAGSEQRQSVRHVFDRVLKRMRNATAAGSVDHWTSLFGL